MAWRFHDFECSCGHTFENLVDNRDFKPDPCPKCGKEGATLLAVTKVNSISQYVPDYPGANQHRAGFADLRRPPDKKGRQISMNDGGKKKATNASKVPTAPVRRG
jgi:hypothetical protein